MLNICRTPLCPNEFRAVGATKYCAECRKLKPNSRAKARLVESEGDIKPLSKIEERIKPWMLGRGSISTRSNKL